MSCLESSLSEKKMEESNHTNYSTKTSYHSSPDSSSSLLKKQAHISNVIWPVHINDYERVISIGHGKFSTVWSGYCKPNQLKVCIKILDLENSTYSFEDILQEVQIMRLCDYPNILNCFCCFVHHDQLWLISQLMEKGSCARVMEIYNKENHVEGLMEECVAYILYETLKGLNYLHSRGLIHRNVKAGNILLGGRGIVKLADFGLIASAEQRTKPTITQNDHQNTYLYNIAPEVLDNHNHGQEIDHRSDIWSIGITALELAKGATPYAQYASTNLLEYMQHYDPPSLASYSHDKQLTNTGHSFSKFFEDFVKKCLQKNNQLRPSVGELLKHKLLRNTHKEGLLQILGTIPNVDGMHMTTSQEEIFASIPMKKVDSVTGEYYSIMQSAQRVLGTATGGDLRGEEQLFDANTGSPKQSGGGGGGKKKKGVAEPRIVISRVQRQKRKFITVVVGLDTVPDLKIKDAAKVFGRKFSSGSSVSDTPQGGKEVVIQGDVTFELPQLLVSEFKIPPTMIFLLDEGSTVPRPYA